jgi:hypothetical protein
MTNARPRIFHEMLTIATAALRCQRLAGNLSNRPR